MTNLMENFDNMHRTRITLVEAAAKRPPRSHLAFTIRLPVFCIADAVEINRMSKVFTAKTKPSLGELPNVVLCLHTLCWLHTLPAWRLHQDNNMYA